MGGPRQVGRNDRLCTDSFSVLPTAGCVGPAQVAESFTVRRDMDCAVGGPVVSPVTDGDTYVPKGTVTIKEHECPGRSVRIPLDLTCVPLRVVVEPGASELAKSGP